MNCCSKFFFNTRYRQAFDDRVPGIRYSAEGSNRTEYRFSPTKEYLSICLPVSRFVCIHFSTCLCPFLYLSVSISLSICLLVADVRIQTTLFCWQDLRIGSTENY